MEILSVILPGSHFLIRMVDNKFKYECGVETLLVFRISMS